MEHLNAQNLYEMWTATLWVHRTSVVDTNVNSHAPTSNVLLSVWAAPYHQLSLASIFSDNLHKLKSRKLIFISKWLGLLVKATKVLLLQQSLVKL